ncbi:Ecto-ADP-ribosyltransferase 4, partial [Dissostichus eleginoides]
QSKPSAVISHSGVTQCWLLQEISAEIIKLNGGGSSRVNPPPVLIEAIAQAHHAKCRWLQLNASLWASSESQRGQAGGYICHDSNALTQRSVPNTVA